jgi:hypothetical protein
VCIYMIFEKSLSIIKSSAGITVQIIQNACMRVFFVDM